MSNSKKLHEAPALRTRLLEIANLVEWLEMPAHDAPDSELKDFFRGIGMMPAHALIHIIRELKIPKVSHIAIDALDANWAGEENGYGLICIRANYKGPTGGRMQVELFFVDTGCDCQCLFTKVYQEQHDTDHQNPPGSPELHPGN